MRLYIYTQYHANIAQPVKYKESLDFVIFVSALTKLYMSLKMCTLFIVV